MRVERAVLVWTDDLGRERESELEPPSEPVTIDDAIDSYRRIAELSPRREEKADKSPQQLPDPATDIEVPDHIEDATAREAVNAALWDVREREPGATVTRVADYVVVYLQAAGLWEW